MKLIIGGPSYRMENDARHTASIATFGIRITLPRIVAKKSFGGKMRAIVTPSGVTVLGFHYEHGTPVALARNSMFKTALAEAAATHLLWVDSDVSLPGDQSDFILAGIRGADPITLFPCPQRDRHANIWTDAKTKLTSLRTDGTLRECYAGGFGAVAFNLEWYREHWPEGPWFRDSFDATIGYLSEDYVHCRALVARGARCLYAATYVDHHDRGDGKPLVADTYESAAAR